MYVFLLSQTMEVTCACVEKHDKNIKKKIQMTLYSNS